MENQIINNNQSTATMMEKALLNGDLSSMNPNERMSYYSKVCDSLGLNPFTRPFDYITLNGKLTLYAKKDTTEQLRKINGISIKITDRQLHDGIYVVTALATDKTGRTDEAIGAVSVGTKKGDDLANALMKAETKAKRRVTLSISGLGWLDETETETIPDTKLVNVTEDGEIIQTTKAIPEMAQNLDDIPDFEMENNGKLHCKSCGIVVSEKVYNYHNLGLCMKCQKELK
jgi:hypothetical protein